MDDEERNGLKGREGLWKRIRCRMEKHLSLHKEKGKGREERGGCNGLETRERRLYGKRTETRRGRKGDS